MSPRYRRGVAQRRYPGRVTTSFSVQRLASFSVDSFPVGEVYGATSGPELRLITCGGDYSRARGRYLQNTVVFATFQS